MRKKTLFMIFFESIITCVQKKYRIMYIDMLLRWKSKYVHTRKINDKFHIWTCLAMTNLNVTSKTYLISCFRYSFTVVYLYSSYDSQTNKKPK